MAGFGLFRRLVGAAQERRGGSRVQAQAGLRVLVVDDSATIRAVLGKMLAQDGYEVLKAADGEEALALARAELPGLIFLDIVLPGMSGFSVLRQLRRDPATGEIPIVMISGNVQATEQFYVQRFGADDFMKKPFGRSEVFDRIRKLVDGGKLPRREKEDAAAPAPAAAPEASHSAWHSIPDIALPDEQLAEKVPASLSFSSSFTVPQVQQTVTFQPPASAVDNDQDEDPN